MKTQLLLLMILVSNWLYAQNLVLNPSFEDTLDCPHQINQINFANGWDSWGVTPDYFNACANIAAPNFGVPHNNRGFQVAHSGIAYVGLFTFTVFNPNMREFVGGTLTTPLTIGQQYFVSFWVNHADTSIVGWATDRIGIKFSTFAHNFFAIPDTVNNAPHVFSTNIISDTASWVLVQGSFIADSAYTFFGIGNYFEDAATSQIQISSGIANYAYYLVDDVCVSTSAGECNNVTGLQDSKLVEVSNVYPNPNKGKFKIVLSNEFQDHHPVIIISNFVGQKIIEKKLSDKVMEIELEQPDGIYFVIVYGDERSYSTKVIVRN